MLSSYFRNRQSKSDFVTMPTELAIRKLIGEGAEFPVPVAAVSNGVDLSSFNPGKADSSIYRKYKIPSEVPIVLYIGRVDPEKEVGQVIQAFKKARAKVPTAELVIVGDGVERAKLEGLAKSLPGVHFLGRVLPPDLYELYKVGTVFATASPIETQGIVLIEAAASGMPLIAVNAGAVAEVCRDGENGVLCQPGSVEEIAQAIVKVMSDDKLREKYSRRSVEIAHEHDFEKTLDKFINIYSKVVRDASGGVELADAED
jgi:glycosyltransferase involved in cell wall biosynthesis